MGSKTRRALLIAIGVAVLAAVVWSSCDCHAPSEPSVVRESKETNAARLTAARARRERLKKKAVQEDSAPTARALFDRVLVAEDTTMGAVLEVSALFTSTIGATLADCLGLDDERGPLAPLKKLGLDPRKDLDRLALLDGGALVSGDFGALPGVAELAGEKYGDHGRIVELPGEGAMGMRYAGTWGDGVLFAFDSKDKAQRAIDRLEDRLSAGTPLIPEAEAYGDVYGSIDVQSLAHELLPAGSDASLPNGQAIFHLDLEQRMYQSIELPIGIEDRARVKQSIERFVADKKQALKNGQKMPMTDYLGEALEGVVASDFESGLRIEATFPTEHLTRWFTSCRLLLPHAPPPGWSAKEEPLIPQFTGPAPPGLVSLAHNRLMLARTYPELAAMFTMLAREPASTWFDPVSLQMMIFDHTAKAGVCERSAKLDAHPAMGKVETVVDARGRSWKRSSTLDQQTKIQSFDYRYCEDDRLWSVSITVQRFLHESVAQARVEAYLGSLELVK